MLSKAIRMFVIAISVIVIAGTLSTVSAQDSTVRQISYVSMPNKGMNEFNNVVINEDGSNRQIIARKGNAGGGGGGGPVWFPDGKRYVDQACYWREGPTLCSIFLRTIDNSMSVNLSALNATGRIHDINPSVSPDGKFITYEHFVEEKEESGWKIFTMNSDGTGKKRITSSALGYAHSPSWSPDGKRIIFIIKSNNSVVVKSEVFSYIAVMNPDGSDVQTVGSVPNYTVGAPQWSTTGTIALVGCKNPCGPMDKVQMFDIFTRNSDGTNIRQLTTSGDNADPAWSPDGKRLVFVSRRGGSSQIYMMNSDGTDQHPISPAGEDAYDPAWVPQP